MAQQIETSRPGDPEGILTGYRWLTALFAALVIVQAFLGMRGFVDAREGLVTMHEMLANTMFLLAVGQTVLAWLLYTKQVVTMRDLVLNGVLVLLTIAQIGLGYSASAGDNFASLISLHVPNGVLMMGVSTVLAATAWLAHTRRGTRA
jgi:hypothetical protein